MKETIESYVVHHISPHDEVFQTRKKELIAIYEENKEYFESLGFEGEWINDSVIIVDECYTQATQSKDDVEKFDMDNIYNTSIKNNLLSEIGYEELVGDE